jgi:hypothetical protein
VGKARRPGGAADGEHDQDLDQALRAVTADGPIRRGLGCYGTTSPGPDRDLISANR